MATPIDDVYFMIMTGIWKMSDLEGWVEDRENEAIEEHRPEIHKEGYDEGYDRGWEDSLDEVADSVKHLRK